MATWEMTSSPEAAALAPASRRVGLGDQPKKGGFLWKPSKQGEAGGRHGTLVCLHVFINAFPTEQCVTCRVCLGGSEDENPS